MKILQIAGFFYPHIGGSENYILELSKQLRMKQHQVLVVTSQLQDDLPYQEIDGIDVLRIPGIHIPNIPYFIFSPKLIYYLLDLSKQFDVVHTHVRFFMSSNIASALKKLANFPLVMTLHATRPNIKYSFMKPMEKVFDSTLGKFTANSADRLIALDDNVMKHAISFGVNPDKFIIIPNGVDINRFSFSQRVSANPIIIGFIGNLVKRKGVEYLIRAFKPIARDYNVLLRLAGGGPEMDTLQRLSNELRINNSVEFVGPIHREHVPEFLGNIDILVLPSLAEGMPTVLLEAMASGKSVIGTNVGSVPTLINSDKVGIIVPPENADSITQALVKLIENEQVRLSMGKEARTRIENSFSWEKVADQIETVYESVLGDHHRS